MTTIGDYVLEKSIGSGTFASVLLGTHSITKSRVAVKKIARTNFNDPDCENRFHKEVDLIRGLDHPFIAEFYDVIEDDSYYYIIMEYVENGNMLDFVNNNGELQEGQARHYFCQLVSVLEYLHEEKKIAHRDLKAENILLDRNNNIRLIDFGLSNLYTDENPFLKTACGSPAYASPEMIRGQSYTIQSDLWSTGILLYAMVMGELPFEDDNMQRLLQKIAFTEPKYPPNISPQLKDLLCRMLTKNPIDRITLQKIKEHPWFSQYTYSQMMNMNFGINCDWRVLSGGIGGNIDRDIITQMTHLGFDCAHIVNDLFEGTVNSLTAVYRMLKKIKIADEMRDISLASIDSQRRLQRGTTQTSSAAKALVRRQPVPLPSLTDRRSAHPVPLPSGVKLVASKQANQEVSASMPFGGTTTATNNATVDGSNGVGTGGGSFMIMSGRTGNLMSRQRGGETGMAANLKGEMGIRVMRPVKVGTMQRKRSNSMREANQLKKL